MAALTDGHECGAAVSTIHDNVAHSSLLGLWYEQRLPVGSMARIYGSDADGTLGVTSRAGYPIGSQTKGTCYEISTGASTPRSILVRTLVGCYLAKTMATQETEPRLSTGTSH